MPRAVVGNELGPIENYSLQTYDPGQPKPGEVRIAVKAAGVSFVDILNATGQYQIKPPVPFIPGSELAGVVEAVGDEVTGFMPGQVVTANAYGGVFADVINVRSGNVHSMPTGFTFAEGAVFMVSATTSWHGLVDRGRVQAGETVLVLGAGGATGYAAVQIAKYLGARVIGSASSGEKRAMVLAGGADAVVDARSATWREDVKRANGGKPVDVVFDPVGGTATEPAFRSLAWNGRHLVVGFPGGISSLPTNLPLLKGASLVGVNIQQMSVHDSEQAVANVKTLYTLAGQGLFKPVVAETYPLDKFAEAMNAAAAGQSAGRILILT